MPDTAGWQWRSAPTLNGHRIAHGGIVFALADTTFAYVCNGANEKTVSAQAGIVFLGSAEEEWSAAPSLKFER